MDRRNFLKAAGVGAAAFSPLGSTLPIMAGPFEENEYLKIIPQDKRLHPEWVQSLFERGHKETYSDPNALAYIGMPIGGLFAGTVYLGGDGRLWLKEYRIMKDALQSALRALRLSGMTQSLDKRELF